MSAPAAVVIEPDEIFFPDGERLARNFIEGATEYNLEEVPEDARKILVEWCRSFIGWANGAAV